MVWEAPMAASRTCLEDARPRGQHFGVLLVHRYLRHHAQ
jgi:hypothetical protein